MHTHQCIDCLTEWRVGYSDCNYADEECGGADVCYDCKHPQPATPEQIQSYRQREERYQAALAVAASLPAVQVDQYELVNLTPHEILLLPDGGTKIIVSPSGTVARVEMARVPGLGGLTIGGVPVWHTTVASRGVLPLQREHRYYLVSRVVAEAHPGRLDLLIPDEAVRDADGRIIGCRALASVADNPAAR